MFDELRPYQQDLVDRFYAMTQNDPETGCILWVRAKNRKGYGLLKAVLR